MHVRVQASEGAFEAYKRQLGDLVDELAGRGYYRFSRSVRWQPRVNVYEDDRNVHLLCELPGLLKDQIHVEVSGRRLTIRGERPAPPPPEGAQPSCILRMEIDSGPFERIIELPAEADMGAVEARLDNGFLWITVAKRPQE
jgi:HSP20 family protein